MKNQFVARQGDVLLIKVASIPKGAKDVTPENDDVILAYGEVTGHAHRIKRTPEPSVRVLDFDEKRYLEVLREVALRHEEHSTIVLTAGKYLQGYQHEEKRAEISRVAD